VTENGKSVKVGFVHNYCTHRKGHVITLQWHYHTTAAQPVLTLGKNGWNAHDL